MVPWAKLKIPDVLYVNTRPVPANPYTEPAVRPTRTNGKRSFTAHTSHRGGNHRGGGRPPRAAPSCPAPTGSPRGDSGQSRLERQADWWWPTDGLCWKRQP